jgi:NitT/TauT family transport system substrate-binding protein
MKLSRHGAIGAAAGAGAYAVLATPAIAAGMPVVIASVTNDTCTPALYALKAGLFERAGLDATFQGMSSGAAASAAVAGGSAQFGLSSLGTLIVAHAHGIPFQLVAPGSVVTSDVPYAEAVVRSDSTVRSGRDLAGKVFAVPALGDQNQVAAMAWIDKTGGDARSVRFIELSSAATVPALVEGRVDAAQLGTPILAIALASGKVRKLASIFDAIVPRFANVAWFATTSYIDANGDTVRRFAEVIRAASAYANGHHAETLPLIAQYTKIDAATLAGMARVAFAERLDPRDIQPLVDACARYGVIERRFDASDLIGRPRAS